MHIYYLWWFTFRVLPFSIQIYFSIPFDPDLLQWTTFLFSLHSPFFSPLLSSFFIISVELSPSHFSMISQRCFSVSSWCCYVFIITQTFFHLYSKFYVRFALRICDASVNTLHVFFFKILHSFTTLCSFHCFSCFSAFLIF